MAMYRPEMPVKVAAPEKIMLVFFKNVQLLQKSSPPITHSPYYESPYYIVEVFVGACPDSCSKLIVSCRVLT